MESSNSLRLGKVNGATLKIIAIVTMLIDHIGAAVLEAFLYSDDEYFNALYYTDLVFRGIGRLAFPIFIFLLVEGFFYSRDLKKYALRLFLFALISEVPFDLAFNGAVWDLSYQNVFFTLLLGFLALCLIYHIQKRFTNWGVRVILAFLALVGLGTLAELLATDYGFGGVVAIVFMAVNTGDRNIGLVRRTDVGMPSDEMIYKSRGMKTATFAISVIFLACTCGFIELIALLDLPLIYFYNGKRGRQIKYFFYLFYPVHLLILWGVRTLIISGAW